MRGSGSIALPHGFLVRLSEHMSMLSEHVAGLEHVLSDLPAGNDEAIRRAQRIDFVRQSLQDLSTLLRICEDVEDWPELQRSAHKLCLTSSQALLCDEKTSAIQTDAGLSEGDVDLF